jgi:hypothetical protein
MYRKHGVIFSKYLLNFGAFAAKVLKNAPVSSMPVYPNVTSVEPLNGFSLILYWQLVLIGIIQFCLKSDNIYGHIIRRPLCVSCESRELLSRNTINVFGSEKRFEQILWTKMNRTCSAKWRFSVSAQYKHRSPQILQTRLGFHLNLTNKKVNYILSFPLSS